MIPVSAAEAKSPGEIDHDETGFRFGSGEFSAIAEFEKTTLVAKLAAARKRKRVATGEKVEGRKSHSELRPDVVKLAKALARKKLKGGKAKPARHIPRTRRSRVPE